MESVFIKLVGLYFNWDGLGRSLRLVGGLGCDCELAFAGEVAGHGFWSCVLGEIELSGEVAFNGAEFVLFLAVFGFDDDLAADNGDLEIIVSIFKKFLESFCLEFYLQVFWVESRDIENGVERVVVGRERSSTVTKMVIVRSDEAGRGKGGDGEGDTSSSGTHGLEGRAGADSDRWLSSTFFDHFTFVSAVVGRAVVVTHDGTEIREIHKVIKISIVKDE